MQRRCCVALVQMALVGTTRDAAVRAGGIEAVLATMRAHGAVADTVEPAIRALGNLLADFDEGRAVAASVDRACAAGAAELIVAGMRAHRAHTDLQASGCVTLVALVAVQGVPRSEQYTASTNVAIAIAAGAIETVLQAMEADAFPGAVAASTAALPLRAGSADFVVQREGLHFLQMALVDAATSARASAAGAVEAVVAALHKLRADAAASSLACFMLNLLVTDGLHERAAAAGACGALLAALEAHREDIAVQHIGASALGNMLFEAPECVVAAAVADGAIETLTAAMQAHPDDLHVQAEACRAFEIVVDASATDSAPAVLRRAGAAGTVEALVRTIQRHDNPALLQLCCRRLVHLCVAPDNRTKAGLAGATAAVAAGMRAHVDDVCVQQAACFALSLLVADAPDNRNMAAAAGCIEAIIAAMQMHGQEGGLQEYACAALWHLVRSTPSNCIRAAAAGATAAVVTAMIAHPLSLNVQTMGCRMLDELAGEAVNRAAFEGAGAAAAVLAAMKTFPEGSMQHLGCAALVHLVQRIGRGDEVCAAGAIEVMMCALQQAASSSLAVSDVQALACLTLTALAARTCGGARGQTGRRRSCGGAHTDATPGGARRGGVLHAAVHSCSALRRERCTRVASGRSSGVDGCAELERLAVALHAHLDGFSNVKRLGAASHTAQRRNGG